MARTYKRDSAGRFSSGGGGPSKKGNSKKSGLTYEKSLQNLDRLNKMEKAAEKGKSAKGKSAAKDQSKPANTISPSPRRRSAFETAVADVLTSSKFKSDKQRMAELNRRGFPSDAKSIWTMRANIIRKQKADPNSRDSVKAALRRAANKK